MAAADPRQYVDGLPDGPRLPQVEAGPEHGGREGRQLGLDRGAEGIGEPLGRLHHHVDEEAAAVESQLGALFVEVGDGLRDLCPGVLPDAGAFVEHPVHRRLAQPRLLGDLANLVPMWHVTPWRADANAPHSRPTRALYVCSLRC